MHKEKRSNRKNGFSMIELMAVLVIMGLLMTVAMGKFIGQIDKAKVKTTKANLVILRNAITNYRMDVGSYPEEDPGLYALVDAPPDAEDWQPGGYLESTDIPMDGWKNDFDYIRDPEPDQPFVIISYGADGEPEGEGYDADLYSTDAN